MMRISVILSIILLLVSFVVVGSEIPADKNVIVFHGKLGDVTFNHKLHSGLENVGGVEKVQCGTCHHTYEGEGAVKACSDCHVRGKKADPAGAPDLKKAFHFRCRNCHKYTMEQGKHAGPDKKCKLCHVKSKS
jgi:Zn finger protein HypA/HybF involved in hydrogenase expression